MEFQFLRKAHLQKTVQLYLLSQSFEKKYKASNGSINREKSKLRSILRDSLLTLSLKANNLEVKFKVDKNSKASYQFKVKVPAVNNMTLL